MGLENQPDKNKVCAVVVTHSRKELLRKCIVALKIQTRPLDEVIVVDNDSKDGTEMMILTEYPDVTYVRMPGNTGGAHGFSEGMKLAIEKGYDWIWIMDDDARAAKDCLDKLFTHITQGDILKPIQIDSIGRIYGQGYWRGRYVMPAQLQVQKGILRVELFSFVGPLISRRVIKEVGFPRGDFFVYGDDLEYGLRMRNAGLAVYAVLDAVMYHDLGGKPILAKRLGQARYRYPQEAWKFYYDARNNLIMFQLLSFWGRLSSYFWYSYLLVRNSIGDFLFEPEWKRRLHYRWLGLLDGIEGTTGKRIDPDQH